MVGFFSGHCGGSLTAELQTGTGPRPNISLSIIRPLPDLQRLGRAGCQHRAVLYCTVLYCAGCQHRAILRISAARQLMNMCTQITFKSNAKRIQIHSDSFIRLRGKMGGSVALQNTRKYSAYCAFCTLNSTIVSNFCSPPPLAAVASPLQTSHAVNNIP